MLHCCVPLWAGSLMDSFSFPLLVFFCHRAKNILKSRIPLGENFSLQIFIFEKELKQQLHVHLQPKNTHIITRLQLQAVQCACEGSESVCFIATYSQGRGSTAWLFLKKFLLLYFFPSPRERNILTLLVVCRGEHGGAFFQKKISFT